MLSPNLLERNSCLDKHHEGMASWIKFITGSKGHDRNRSRRQKRKIYFKRKEETSNWSEEVGLQSNYRSTDKDDNGK